MKQALGTRHREAPVNGVCLGWHLDVRKDLKEEVILLFNFLGGIPWWASGTRKGEHGSECEVAV